MKIAVPTRDGNVDDHFGHCDYYTIFSINENKEIICKERMDSPEGCGCKSGIAPVLRDMGVEIMLAGNMGEGAKNVLESNSISVVRGCCGNVDVLVEDYLLGKVSDNGELCKNHECGDGEHSHEHSSDLKYVKFEMPK